MADLNENNKLWIVLTLSSLFACIKSEIDYCFDSCDNACNWQCYLDNYPDLIATFGDGNYMAAKNHYHQHGIAEGRNCQCVCDWQCYLDNYVDLQAAFGPNNLGAARDHYHIHGKNEGRNCGCLCNWQCYLDNYPDLHAAFGGNNFVAAKNHYHQYGKAEGRNCGCICNWQCYLENYVDLQIAFGPHNIGAAKDHYHIHGKNEGRNCGCLCDWQCYLKRFPDLQNAFGCNLDSAQTHYYQYGKNEGRNCQCSESDSTPNPNLNENYAIKFAPVLKFDRAASSYGYPMNVQLYGQNNGEIRENNMLNSNGFDDDTLMGFHNPTYWSSSICCNGNTKTLKIVYWWWYGYQHSCDPEGNGEHAGDWERIIIHTTTDKVEKVTYYQHGGHYTIPSSNIDFVGDHPIVYVGKTSHGSYHNANAFQLSDYSGCGYFYDYRNPASSKDHLHTKHNLISLDTKSESELWMKYPDSNHIVVTCCSNPLKFDHYDICESDGCDDIGCRWEQCDSESDLAVGLHSCSGVSERIIALIKDWMDKIPTPPWPFAKAVESKRDISSDTQDNGESMWIPFIMGLVGVLLLINCLVITVYCISKNKKSKVYQFDNISDESS